MKRLFVLLVEVVVLFGLGTSGLMAQKKSPEKQFVKMDENGDQRLNLEEFAVKKKADKATHGCFNFGDGSKGK